MFEKFLKIEEAKLALLKHQMERSTCMFEKSLYRTSLKTKSETLKSLADHLPNFDAVKNSLKSIIAEHGLQ